MSRTLFILPFLLLCSIATAQENSSQYFFKDVELTSITSNFKKIIPIRHYRLVALDLSQLYAELENAPHRDQLKSAPPSTLLCLYRMGPLNGIR
jgi:hypothetical protein